MTSYLGEGVNMKDCRAWCACLFLLLWTALSCADVPENIPASVPAAQQSALASERAALLVEKKKLDAQVARHNKVCSSPSPYHAQKCSEDRLVLFQQEDSHQKNVKDFNKRLSAAADQHTEIKTGTDKQGQ
jgi:hypothetical protein